jgi:hypothetical protein
MTTVRCYVPVSHDQLTLLRDDRVLPGPLPAYAVTDVVREANPAGDAEEWEYAVMQEAARGLVRDGGPVMIAAVDILRDRVRPGETADARVEVGDIDLPRVAALHLGDDVVTGEAEALVGQGQDGEVELSWYDTTELSHVIELAQALADGPDPD